MPLKPMWSAPKCACPSNEPLILDASIYDLEGSVLIVIDAMSLDQLTGLNTLFLSQYRAKTTLEPVIENNYQLYSHHDGAWRLNEKPLTA